MQLLDQSSGLLTLMRPQRLRLGAAARAQWLGSTAMISRRAPRIACQTRSGVATMSIRDSERTEDRVDYDLRSHESCSERSPPACSRHLYVLAQPEGPLDRHKATQNGLQRLALITAMFM